MVVGTLAGTAAGTAAGSAGTAAGTAASAAANTAANTAAVVAAAATVFEPERCRCLPQTAVELSSRAKDQIHEWHFSVLLLLHCRKPLLPNPLCL